MYLHLGQHTMVNTADVIGLFDLDTSTLSKKTRDFLAKAQRENRVVNTSNELPKSFVVTVDEKDTVYISQLSALTLKKRLENIQKGKIIPK